MSERFGPAYAAATGPVGARALLPDAFRSAAGREAAVERAGARPLHPAVRAALVEQNTAIRPAHHGRQRGLTKLNAHGVSVVVTGQQVGLFGGPLYALWKAATAVVWAERLEAETGRPVVPVFWLQTEDHDLAEIASTSVVDPRNGVHTIALDHSGPTRASVAHARFDESVLDATSRLRELLTGLPHAEAACAAASVSYRPGQSWAAAFTRLLARVFANTELLFLDPRTEELAALAMPVHRWAVAEHDALARALAARADAIAAHGFEVQVPPRADCSLSFFHPDGPEGPRFRLRRHEVGWSLAGRETEAMGDVLERALRNEPMRWSSSALLRPLVQDTLLPTAAYVGGPGEIAYWAQLPPLYEAYGLPVPLVVPRMTGTFVDSELRTSLHALDLTPTTLPRQLDAILEALGPAATPCTEEDLEARTRSAMEAVLAEARARATALDPAIASAFDKTVENAARGVAKLERRLHAATLRADPERNAHARAALARVYPGGAPQDRALCVPDLAARVGLDHIVPPLLAAIRASDLDAAPPLTVSL
jgi:bacillithiol biosynthesis cysteine-adding enzyme BshC